MRHYRRNDDSSMGCLVIVLLAIFAMPLVGLYMIVKGEENQKVLGVVLVIIGIILWIYFGVQ